MRKSILLISSCLILGLIAYYTWSKKDSTFGFSGTRFKLTKAGEVTEIHLSSDENKTVLVKSDNSWKVGNEEADEKRIHDVLILSSGIEALAPAPLSMKNILNDELEKGISVAFFIHHKSILSFEICRIENQLFARLKNSKNAFKITVKAYPNVDLFKVYDPLPIHWKSNILLDLAPAAIESIVIEYPEKPSDGFRILRTDKKNPVLLDYLGIDTIANIDIEAINEYFHFFSKIKYVPSSEEILPININSLKNEVFFSLKITTTARDTFNLTGCRRQLNQSGEIDLYHFYGITIENDYLILNYSDFDPILVPFEYFRKK